MNIPRTLSVYCVLPLALVLWSAEAAGQTAIQNPLVRPAWSTISSNAAGGGRTEGQGGAEPAPRGRGGESAPPAPPSGDPVLRDKAEARLTQEDFNIRQQTLNAANVPAPLVAMFDQMAVSAHVSNAVVLRRFDRGPSSASQPAPNPTPQPSPNPNPNGQATAMQPAVRTASPLAGGLSSASSVLRLKVGRNTNINGYTLRARVEDLDVTVEWLNDQGRWVTVFFGAVESGQSLAVVPAELEKVDTKAFDYLVPNKTSQIVGGAGGGLGGGAGGFNGGGFNQGGGLGGGFGQSGGNGFGSAPPLFR